MKFLIRLLVAGLAAVSAAVAAEAPRPNIIFILADDLGPGDIGVLWQNARSGTQKFQTPHLDQFAAEGKILTRHYCPVSVCAPSRASLLLGVHQGHANIRDNEFDDEIEKNHTLATVLKQAGYATANIGKWGLAGNNNTLPGHPQKRGFDYFFGYINHGDAHYHYPKETSVAEGVNARVYDGYTLVTSQLDKAYSTDFITARSKKWLVDQKTAHPDQPFFLYLAYTAPHARLDLPTQAYPAGGGINGGLQWTGTPGALVNTASGTVNSYLHPDYAQQDWPEYAKRHATIVRRLDDAVQDLIQTLKDLGADQNTLIIFTSDNGTHNEGGSGGTYTYNPTYFATYGPYDGIKRDLWEGGIRMPALVRWPAGITAGTTSAAPSQFHDWLPTFAQLAGVQKPERSDGVSILPTLTGQGEQKKGTVYSEYYYAGSTPNYGDFEAAHRSVTRNQMQVVQIGDYKAVRTNISSHEGTNFRVYNVATDLKETTDLAGQPGVPTQREFKDLTLRLRRANADAPRPYDNELIPSLSLPGFANGLTWRSYEVAAPWVPDLEDESPVASGSTGSLDLAVRSRESDVGILYSGYVRVPADGTYQFHLTTDTGAFIRIHDVQLLDADYDYAAGTDRSSGNIPLKAGFHPVRIYYRHANAATHQLGLQWSGPGITLQDVPASAFFVEAEPQPSAPVASDDYAQTIGRAGAEGNAVEIAVLSNDLDADNLPAPLSIVSATTPPNGRVAISGTKIVYTPRAGFFGEDAFSYIVTDGASQTSATVHVSVYAAGDDLWLPLDETSGTTAYEAGGRPLGVLTGFGSSGWTAGKLSGGLRFAGATAPKVILTGQKGVTGTHARTIAFWANVDADQGSGIRSTLVSWGGSNGSGAANNGRRLDINLNHSTGYRFRAEFNGGGINFNTSTVSDPRGAGWVHVAIVIPENSTFATPTGYLNGQLATGIYEGSVASGTVIDTATINDITLGGWATDASRPFRGVLDEVHIYPRALSAAEVAALASATPERTAASAWFFRYQGRTTATAEDWQADTDADGLTAWQEYALGGNPNIGFTGIRPSFDPVAKTFAFNRRRSGIAATRYVAEYSQNLAPDSWTALGNAVVSDHPDDAQLQKVVVPVPDGDRGFVRLSLGQGPE